MTDYDATIAIGIAIDKLDKLNELAVSIDRIIMAIDSVNERQAVAGKIAAAASDVSEEVGGALSQITRGTADSGAAAAGIVKLASGFAEIRKAATQAIKDTRPIVGASKTLADSIVEGFDLGEARKEVFADMDSFFTAIEKQLGIEKTTLAQIFSLSDILIAGGTGEKEAVATAKAVFDQVVNAAIKAREKYHEKNEAAKLGVGQIEDVTKQIGQKTAPRLLPIDPGVADLQVKGIAQIGDAWGIVIDAQDAVGSGARRLAQLQNDANTRTVLSVHNIVDSLEGVDEAIQQTARTALNASKSEVDFVAALLHPGQIENANKFMQLLEGLLKKKRENIKIEADKVAAEIKEATKTEQIELNKATKQRIKASEEYEKMINLLRTGRLSKNDPSVSESARNRIEREQAEDAEAAMRSRFRAETQYRLDILGLMYKEYQGQELTLANALEIIAAKRAEAELADKVADAQYAQERAQLRNLEVKQKIIQTTAKIERDATGNTIANREVLADIHIKEAQALKRTNEALIQNAALSDASHKANVTRNQQLKTLQENIRIGGIEYGDEEKAAQYIVEQERIAKIEEESIRRARDLASEKQEFEQALMREASLQDQSAQSQEARDYKRLSIENQLLEVKKRNFDLIVQVAEAETRASNLELVKAAEKLKLERAARGEVERTTTAVREKTEALTAEQKAQQRVNQEAQKQEAAEMDRRNILGSLGTRIQFYERQLDAVFRAGFRLKMVGMDLRFVGERMSTTVNELVGSFAEFEFMSSKAAGALGSWATTSEDASENFSTLQEKVIDASIALKLFGATEISQALYFYASTTGQMVDSAEDLDDIFTALTPIMQAAAITGTNYETAIKGVYSVVAQFNPELITLAATMGDYGVISEKIADVTHKLFAVTQATAAEMPDLINSFKMVGSVAGQSGAKFEDIVDLFGRLADLGIRGTMAGRGLRQMFIQMVRPAPAAVSALTELFAREEVQAAAPEFSGKSYYEIFFPKGEFLGTKRYIETLAKALDAVDASYKRFVLSRISTANELPILTAMVQQQQMFSKNAALAQSKTMDLNENAAKIFSAAWERSANTTKAALGVVQNAFDAIRITVGGAIAEGIEPWLNSIAEVASKVLDFVRSNQVLAASIGKIGAALGVLLTVAGGLTMIAGSIIGFFAAVKLVFAAFIPVAATIGGGILTIVALVQVFMDRADDISAAWDRLTSNISKNTKDVEISFDDMVSYIRNILEPFAEVIDTLIVGPMIALINGLAEITSSVSGVSGTVDVLTGLLKILSYYFGVKLVADIAKFAKSTRVAGFLFGKEMTRTVGEVLDDKGNVITPGTKEKYREQGALSRARETISRSIPKNNMEESFYAYRRLYEGTYAGPLRLQKPPGIDPLTGLPLGPMHGPPKPIPGMGSLDEISKAEKALVGVGAAGRVAFGSIKGLTLAVAGLGKAFLTALGPIGWLVIAFSAFEFAVSENFLGLGDIIENFNRSLENSNKKLEESLSAFGDYALEFRKIWSSTEKQIVTVGEEQVSKGLTPDEVQRGVGSYGGALEGIADFGIAIGGRGSYARELINNVTGEVRIVYGSGRTKLNENVAAIQAEWLAQVAEDMEARAKELGQALGQEVTPEYYSKLATALSENLDMSQPGAYGLLLNAVDALVKTFSENNGTITKKAYREWKEVYLPGIKLNYEEFLALINKDTLSAYTASQEAIRQAKNAEYAPYVKDLDILLASGADPSILLEKIQEVIPKDRSAFAIEGWGGPRRFEALEQTLNEFLSGEDVSEETRKWFYDVFIPAVTAGDALAGAELASLVGDYVPVAELNIGDTLSLLQRKLQEARDMELVPAIAQITPDVEAMLQSIETADLTSPEKLAPAANAWMAIVEEVINGNLDVGGSKTAEVITLWGEHFAKNGLLGDDPSILEKWQNYIKEGVKTDAKSLADTLATSGIIPDDLPSILDSMLQSKDTGKAQAILEETRDVVFNFIGGAIPVASKQVATERSEVLRSLIHLVTPTQDDAGNTFIPVLEEPRAMRVAQDLYLSLDSYVKATMRSSDEAEWTRIEELLGLGEESSYLQREINRRESIWKSGIDFVSKAWVSKREERNTATKFYETMQFIYRKITGEESEFIENLRRTTLTPDQRVAESVARGRQEYQTKMQEMSDAIFELGVSIVPAGTAMEDRPPIKSIGFKQNQIYTRAKRFWNEVTGSIETSYEQEYNGIIKYGSAVRPTGGGIGRFPAAEYSDRLDIAARKFLGPQFTSQKKFYIGQQQKLTERFLEDGAKAMLGNKFATSQGGAENAILRFRAAIQNMYIESIVEAATAVNPIRTRPSLERPKRVLIDTLGRIQELEAEQLVGDLTQAVSPFLFNIGDRLVPNLFGAVRPGVVHSNTYYLVTLKENIAKTLSNSSMIEETADAILQGVVQGSALFNDKLNIESIFKQGEHILNATRDENQAFGAVLSALMQYVPEDGEGLNLEELWRQGYDLGEVLKRTGLEGLVESYFDTAVDLGLIEAPDVNPFKDVARSVVNQSIDSFYSSVTSKEEWRKGIEEANKKASIYKTITQAFKNARSLKNLFKIKPAAMAAYSQPLIDALSSIGPVVGTMGRTGEEGRNRLKILASIRNGYKNQRPIVRRVIREAVKLMLEENQITQEEYDRFFAQIFPKDKPKPKPAEATAIELVQGRSGAVKPLEDEEALGFKPKMGKEKPVNPLTKILEGMIESAKQNENLVQKSENLGELMANAIVRGIENILSQDNPITRKVNQILEFFDTSQIQSTEQPDLTGTGRPTVVHSNAPTRKQLVDIVNEILTDSVHNVVASIQSSSISEQVKNVASNAVGSIVAGVQKSAIAQAVTKIASSTVGAAVDSTIKSGFAASIRSIAEDGVKSVVISLQSSALAIGVSQAVAKIATSTVGAAVDSTIKSGFAVSIRSIAEDGVRSVVSGLQSSAIGLGIDTLVRRTVDSMASTIVSSALVRVIQSAAAEAVAAITRALDPVKPDAKEIRFPTVNVGTMNVAKVVISGLTSGGKKDTPASDVTGPSEDNAGMPPSSGTVAGKKTVPFDYNWLIPDSSEETIWRDRNAIYFPENEAFPNSKKLLASLRNKKYVEDAILRYGQATTKENEGSMISSWLDLLRLNNRRPIGSKAKSSWIDQLKQWGIPPQMLKNRVWQIDGQGFLPGAPNPYRGRGARPQQNIMNPAMFLAGYAREMGYSQPSWLKPGKPMSYSSLVKTMPEFGIDPMSPEGIAMSGILRQLYNASKSRKPYKPKYDPLKDPALTRRGWMRKFGIAKLGSPSSYLGPAEDQAGGLQDGLVRTATQTTPSMFKRGPMFKQMLEEARETAKKIPQIISRIVAEYKHWGTYGYNIGKSWGEGWSKGARDGVNNALITIKATTVGNSPPKLGPLKDINRGGRNIGMAWGDAFGGAANESIVKGAAEVKRNLEEQNREFAHRGNMDVTMNRNDKKQIQISLNVTGDGSANRATMSELRKGLMDALVMADLEHMVEVI